MVDFVLSQNINSLIPLECEARNFNLDGAISVLQNLLDLRASSVPEIFRAYSFTATQRVGVLDSTVIPTLPFISVTIACDGPNSVFCFINEKRDIREHDCLNSQQSNVSEIQMGEVMRFKADYSLIERIYLQCAPGYTSTVRIFSTGKRPAKIEEVVQA